MLIDSYLLLESWTTGGVDLHDDIIECRMAQHCCIVSAT
jgi:hypothetical protein